MVVWFLAPWVRRLHVNDQLRLREILARAALAWLVCAICVWTGNSLSFFRFDGARIASVAAGVVLTSLWLRPIGEAALDSFRKRRVAFSIVAGISGVLLWTYVLCGLSAIFLLAIRQDQGLRLWGVAHHLVVHQYFTIEGLGIVGVVSAIGSAWIRRTADNYERACARRRLPATRSNEATTQSRDFVPMATRSTAAASSATGPVPPTAAEGPRQRADHPSPGLPYIDFSTADFRVPE